MTPTPSVRGDPARLRSALLSVRAHPALLPYRAFVDALLAEGRVCVDALDRLARRGTRLPIGPRRPCLRFVHSAGSTRALDYERRIVERGEVETREGSLHDLFNAMVWLRFPVLKARISALHCVALDRTRRDEAGHPIADYTERRPGRGPLRDALTLLDESGAVVAVRDPARLQPLLRRDWRTFFAAGDGAFHRDVSVTVVGHALMEKLAGGQPAIAAKALCLQHAEATAIERAATLALDGVRAPGDLAPLPLFGIPGWDPRTRDPRFYDDTTLFRPARTTGAAAPRAAQAAPAPGAPAEGTPAR